jgi:heme/copper-type cytochrome/quinol oxidase subunit 3
LAKVQPLPVRYQIVPHGVMGMLIFVVTEAMLFAGLISAFMIVKGAAPVWPPPDQPRLPVEATGLNTAALLASGAILYFAGRTFDRDPEAARRPMALALGLGAFFVCSQGFEWVQLIGQGLTLTSSTHGGFFYLIVGVHGLHAIAAIGALGWAFRRLLRQELTYQLLAPVQIFWYFVVGVWPVLYALVYL